MKSIFFVGVGALVFAGMTHAKDLSTGEILQTVHAADHGEILTSKTILAKSKNPEVRSFATKMIKEHSEVEKVMDSYGKTAGVKPSGDTTTSMMSAKAGLTNKELEMMDEPALDKKYIEKQIAMHQDVLDDLDKNLIPNAKDAKLKADLTKIRASVVEHRDMAKTILTKL